MQAILQFGTSRFLQAHVDLFVPEAMAMGQALGGITAVQTTTSSQPAVDIQMHWLRGGVGKAALWSRALGRALKAEFGA